MGYTHANRKTGRKERVCCTGLDNEIRPLVEKRGYPETGVKVEQNRLPGGGECGVWTLSVGRVWLGRDVLSVPEDCEPPEHRYLSSSCPLFISIFQQLYCPGELFVMVYRVLRAGRDIRNVMRQSLRLRVKCGV